MTKEEKELLLKYLCMALPYEIKFLREAWNFEWDQEISVIEVLEDIDKDGYINNTKVYKIEDIKPYLRPMSSMTEEEEIEYDATFATIKLADGHYDSTMTYKSFDFLNEHHFDYRGLIEKGLAIEVTNENNPYESNM